MSEVRIPEGYLATPEEIAYETRAAENSIFTGGRLLIGIYAFAGASLAFAYFYLRSTNSEDLWRPHDMTAPVATGTGIMAITVTAAALVGFGLRQLRAGQILDWEVSGWTAVCAGLLALALQCWELTDLPFAPGASGYASVVIGWFLLNIFFLVSGVYWTETQLARHARLRRAVTEEGGTQARPLPVMFRVNVESSAYFWGFVAFVGVFFWVFVYMAA